jgi:hypothetical protein
MPRIVCWQTDCLHNADGRCRAEQMEYHPVDGCLTLEPRIEFLGSDDMDDVGWGRDGVFLLGDED